MPYKRGGNWYTQVPYHYVDELGVPRTKRIRRKIGARKQDAVNAEAQIRAEIAAGTFDPDPKTAAEAILFATFARDEFVPWSEMEHSPKHHGELVRMIEGRLVAYFGGLHLHEITSKRISDYMQARIGERYRMRGWKASKKTSAATVNRELAAIKAILRQAVAWERLTVSPATGISALKEAPNPPRLLSEDEVARLLAEVPDHLRAVVGCAVYAGLRKTEILRLRWEHVDMKAGMLAVVSRAGRMTKSGKDRRIPINEGLAKLIQQHPRRLGSVYVFPKLRGGDEKEKKGNHMKELRPSLRAAAKRAGIDQVGMHQLRHAFCSHALMAGVDPRTVQMWMGHADLRTTMRYAHTSPEHERAAIQQVRYRGRTEGQERASG